MYEYLGSWGFSQSPTGFVLPPSKFDRKCLAGDIRGGDGGVGRFKATSEDGGGGVGGVGVGENIVCCGNSLVPLSFRMVGGKH